MSILKVAYKNTNEAKEDPVKELSKVLDEKWKKKRKKDAIKFFEKYKDHIPVKGA